MKRKNDGESNKELTRLEQLVCRAERRIKKARARARQVCGRLAEDRGAPEGGKEGDWHQPV